MKLGRDAVPALNKIKTVNNQEILSKFQPEIPDLTFLSKGQLRRMIEDLFKENSRLFNQRIIDLEVINEQKNKILEQQDELIGLYTKLDKTGISPLKIAG